MATASAHLSGRLFETESTAIQARRSDAVYRTHAYHTKVPPSVAASLVERYCPEGGLVLDPFCGSGMTGVGASMVGRRAVLSDLSPAAVHIASNYCLPCEPAAFDAAVDRVLEVVGPEIESLYSTEDNGSPAVVEYVVWSDVRACPDCKEPLVVWEARNSGLRAITCPACSHTSSKADWRYVGEAPVEASLSVAGTRRSRPAEPSDLRSPTVPDGLWFPRTPFGRERPMWRKQHADMGITDVSGFYSARNLYALALLWDAAASEPDQRLRSALRFSITAIVNRASRRYQWNPKRPTNVLGGTLYIASLRYEWNVLSLWRRKVSAVRKLLREQSYADVTVTRSSATDLALADGSVDYCFTDPPFGAHIVYSDASLLWEAWLSDLTDRDQEAIVVRSGDHPKSVTDYGDLLRQSFAEIHRVLKPEAYATVVFQATDMKVWASISKAAQEAGLSLVEVATLDKGQPSFKQVKGRTMGEQVAQSDVVMTFSKVPAVPVASDPDPAAIVAREVALADGGEVSVGHVFSAVAADCLRHGEDPLTFARVAALVREAQEAGA